MGAGDQGPRRIFWLDGIAVTLEGLPDAVERAKLAGERGELTAVHFLTAHLLREARRQGPVRRALCAPGHIAYADGMPLVWVARISGLSARRVCGPEFMPALLSATQYQGRGHYFLGGNQDTLEQLIDTVREQWPGVRIVGHFSPPFRDMTPEEVSDMLSRIRASQASFLWVGLGAPKQDIWLADHGRRCNVPVVIAVGAAFDFVAGTKRRAPKVMRMLGLEWSFRLILEPRRVWRRYLFGNASFVLCAVRTILTYRTGRGAS
jgi:N-acetylglucosaminyldiphosphoundecaprenol N-acetyl-beta-D-mannosaminyltransferase